MRAPANACPASWYPANQNGALNSANRMPPLAMAEMVLQPQNIQDPHIVI
jgi:hypothetical protein